MGVKIIYFVHGTTYDNEKSQCSGWNQVELSDLGKEQAKKLGENTNYNFDVIITSDLIRAIDSANIAWPEVKKLQDKRLRECDYGNYNGKDKKLVVYEKYIDKRFPNGESLKDVEARMRDFIKYLNNEFEGKTVGIMAHRATQLALDVITKNISWDEAIENDWRKRK